MWRLSIGRAPIIVRRTVIVAQQVRYCASAKPPPKEEVSADFDLSKYEIRSGPSDDPAFNKSESNASQEEAAQLRGDELEKPGNNQNDDKDSASSTNKAVTLNKSQYYLHDSIVEEFARQNLEREGRAGQTKAIEFSEDTAGVPILAKGQKNVYDFTDDIPEHVKPMYHYQMHQQRWYFQWRRTQRTWQRTGTLVLFIMVWTFIFVSAVAFTRIWIQQPGELLDLRTRLVQTNCYGKVLELAAGQGLNVGSYPYAVHEIYMCDSNAAELQRLRYRLPKTAYPKYHVVQDRAEYLSSFKDGEFDCVVDMFGLCHYRDPVMVLRQMQRVCKPTGSIILLEHGRTKYPPVNAFLDLWHSKHLEKSGGCHWNLPIDKYIKDARLTIREQTNYHYGTTYCVVAHPEVIEDAHTPVAAA